MHKPSVEWFDSLTESVSALAMAARETRAVSQAAKTLLWNAEPMRLRYLPGDVAISGGDAMAPHEIALWETWRLCQDFEIDAAGLYEDTARAYAYGTAAAVLAVSQGERPPLVELGWHEGGYVVAGPLPDLDDALTDWSGSTRLAVLRSNVIARERAAELARSAAVWDIYADRETHRTADTLASGLADTLHAYGAQATAALHHLLLNNNLGKEQ
ncbi:hypothetical protein ACFP1Z_05360 [Streptomyces gamaensis]|uniref:Uncharacterized protein n=1 Tax=Streptomyces gamaensis TaxID=1763542 RepID=A0ABW0YSX1_9ACTN